MNSWYSLLLWQMAHGRYLRLGPRPVNENDWLILWGLIQEEQVRVGT